MPTRRRFWAALAAAAGLAACGGTAAAQSAPPPAPKFYPTSVTPSPDHQPPPYIPPGGGADAAPRPTAPAGWQTGAPPTGPAPLTAPPVGQKPKPVSGGAVIAGPDGVRPVSATDADLLKPPSDITPGALGTPTVRVEPGFDPKALPLPKITAEKTEIKPPAPAEAPAALPSAVGMPTTPVPTIGSPATAAPTAPPPAVSTMPASSAPAGAKSSPAVTVECEMPESVGVGQPLVYTLVVKNGGTAAVDGVRVAHDLPAGAALVASDPAAESGAEGKLAWAVGTVDAAAEKRIKVTVKPADEGELRGRATVSFSSTVEGRTKVTRPRITVAVSAADTMKVGEKVPFTIKLANIGSGPATRMVLQAKMSDGLGHARGNVLEVEMANLPAGGTKTLTLELDAVKPGQQQCMVTAWADGNLPETVKAGVTLVEPQLVAKQTGPAKCLVKAEPTYTVELTNPGTATTDPVTVWSVVPEGFEFVSATDGGAYTATSKAVGWKLSPLPAGQSKSVSMKLRAVGPSDGVVRTVAQAAAEGSKGKPLESRCETLVKSEGIPSLRFEVVGSEGVVEVGKEVAYEVKVANQGTGACTNVVLVAELADGTVAAGTAGPTNGRPTGAQIVFDPIPTVGVKGEAVYKVRVKGTTPGDMRFRVKLTCDQIKTPVVKEENTKFYKE